MDITAGLKATQYRIRFAEQPQADETVLLEFVDPAPGKALLSSAAIEALPGGPAGSGLTELHVLAVPRDLKDEARKELRAWVERATPVQNGAVVSVKVEDLLVLWRNGRAVVQGPAEKVAALLPGLAEFAYYEAQLRKLEQETADHWPQAQGDTRLAYEVGGADLRQGEALGQRMAAVFQRRIRQVRIELWLGEPGASLAPLGWQLGEALREKAGVEDRLEVLDGKIEVYEYIYEMAAQRMSDFRHARQSTRLEIMIVAILLIETVLMAIDILMWWGIE